jgi:UDP:flavonoid glycosyltransferase YjiC (YdhE family)
MVATVRRAGFTAYATGADDHAEEHRVGLRAPDPQREDRDLRDGFAGWIGRERATAVAELCATWQPDVIVCDETDFGAMIAAERLDLPYASVLVTVSGSFVRHEVIAERLADLRAEHGLEDDPELTMLSRYLVFSPVPARLRHPDYPLPATAHLFRPDAPELTTVDIVPGWLARLVRDRERPIVYVTLGTVFNVESGDLFERIIAGVRDLPVDVVVTLGRQIDPAQLGRQPENVHIERYLPQSLILPHCAAVVAHGGSGSVTGALSHGLPMVLVAMGADQPNNAARCEQLGVAVVLDPVSATPGEVAEAVCAVLWKPAYRQAAEEFRTEIAAEPDPAQAVDLLERLVTQRMPSITG